jgi:hypothetical protein
MENACEIFLESATRAGIKKVQPAGQLWPTDLTETGRKLYVAVIVANSFLTIKRWRKKKIQPF